MKRQRAGVTLLESLVAVAIIGVLVCLVLVGVQRGMELASRTTCKNNLRELALQVHQYQVDHGKMPPYATGRAGEIPGGWFIYLLPYTGYSEMFERIQASSGKGGVIASPVSMKGVGDVQFPGLLCPSDPTDAPQGRGVTNYVANWYAWGDGQRRAYSAPLRFLDMTDGLSNIVLFAEAYQECDGLTRVALQSNYFHNFGITQRGKPSDDPSYLPNDYTMFQIQPLHCDKWRAQTPHGVMQVALADGSVRTVAGSVSPATWIHALKPRDGLLPDGDW